MQKFTYNQEEYYWTGSEWLTAGFVRPPKVIEDVLNREYKKSMPTPTPTKPKPPLTNQNIQDRIAPVIAEIIHRQYAQTNQFVTRTEIVAGLISRPEIKHFLQEAHAQKPDHFTFVEYVGNQVDFFSKGITENTSHYANHFEKTKINNKWAYIPATEAPR